MAAEHVEAKLAAIYEDLRRREYDLINKLLDVLPRIDGLPAGQIDQVRDALFHADHPFLIVFVGPFSSGKSTLINAVLGDADLLPVGPVPTTDRISILRYGEDRDRMRSGDVDTVLHPSPLLKKVSLVDTPGLESVFQQHEEVTRKFMHRSDAVILVMLATQAMTQRNLDYLQMLKEYGKTVIIIVNQVDLLTDEERDTIYDYVLEQSQSKVGYRPHIWMMSARQGIAARQNGTVDDELWRSSGVGQLETYVSEQLSDAARLKQKLQTPLQIIQKTNQTALETLRANQTALDRYRGIATNIDQQIDAQKREQERAIRATNDELRTQFGEAAQRGSEAIRDIFQFNRALSSTARGVFELVGLGRLARRRVGGSYIKQAFVEHKAFEPIDAVPVITNKLAPRMEGRDVQDLDDLARYARTEIDRLPDTISSKLIGTIQAPVQYDRSALQDVRDELEVIENKARDIETERLESALRNTLLYLAAWEVLVIVFGIALLNTWGALAGGDGLLPLVLLVLLIGLGMAGLLVLPLRGRMLEGSYTSEMLNLQAQYIDTLTRAADQQVEYGLGLRRATVLPLTRLIEAQVESQQNQMTELRAIQQEQAAIESELAKLGQRNLLGTQG